MPTIGTETGPDGGRPSDWSGETAAAVSRRRFLAAVSTAGVAGLAGCPGGLSGEGEQRFGENPVADGVGERPRLGPAREETEITVVAFDDPSCPSCASLHDGAFQGIESEWVAAGRATVYNRAFYFVSDWARPAVNALLETYRQAPATYWDLKAAYYEHREDLTEENVAERTESLLEGIDAGGDLDRDAVTRALRDRAHSAAIDADVAAAEAAGVNGVPTVFLFRDGEFVTTLGDDSFDAYESAIESVA